MGESGLNKSNYNNERVILMTASENKQDGITIGYYTKVNKLSKELQKHVKADKVTFFCIGTDRSTGDSFAPLIGTMLEEKGYKNVIGTIDNPVHGTNLNDKVNEIPSNTTVVAIDACLGNAKSIGKIQFNKGKLEAGIGVGKVGLIPVGDFNLKGIVNIYSSREDLNSDILSCTRLSTVMEMSKLVVDSIEQTFPINNHNSERVFTDGLFQAMGWR